MLTAGGIFLSHVALGDRFMWRIPPAAFIGAVLPFYLAKRGGKWWLAIAAVPLGMVASIGMSLVVAATKGNSAGSVTSDTDTSLGGCVRLVRILSGFVRSLIYHVSGFCPACPGA